MNLNQIFVDMNVVKAKKTEVDPKAKKTEVDKNDVDKTANDMVEDEKDDGNYFDNYSDVNNNEDGDDNNNNDDGNDDDDEDLKKDKKRVDNEVEKDEVVDKLDALAEEGEKAVDVTNVRGTRHSRILKVQPKNMSDDHRFFFGSPRGESEEIVYLPPSFSLDPKSVDDAIRSANWKNLQIIMPLDYVYVNRKLHIQELLKAKDHRINHFIISNTAAKSTLCAFALNLDFGCPMELYYLSPTVYLLDLYTSVSKNAK